MVLRRFSAGGLVGVLAVGLLAVGCNPDPGPSPTVSPPTETSAPPTGTPTPTPTENAEEMKQRVAFEAAEKAYRANFVEVGRLAEKGGVDAPSAIMRNTSTGAYLDAQMANLKFLHEQDLSANQVGRIVWLKRGPFSPTELNFEACEDYRKVLLVKSNNETVPPKDGGTRIYQQTIEATLVGGVWKLSDLNTEQVGQC